MKNSFHFIEIWFDHKNFRNFIKIKKLNSWQTRWIIKLIVYDFEIFHRFDFKNFANESFKRFDYENVCFLNTKLLSTLQNKLTLTIDDESLSQNKRKKTFFDYILTNVQFNVVDEFAESSQNKRKILIELIFVFQLIEIQIVIFRKIVNDVFEIFYEKSQKFMKFLLKNLQIENNFVIRFCENILTFSLNERFKSSKIWFVDVEKFLKHEKRIYVSKNFVTQQKFINKNHDDFLIDHFDVERIFELLNKKYYWFVCATKIKNYVRICDICQRIKMHRHQFYKQLNFLSIFKKSFKFFFMNFIMNLFVNKRRNVVYDFILMIIDRLTKMTKYVFVIKKIDVVELTNVFFDEIILRYDMFDDIVNDRNFVFINVFWFFLCFHAKIRKRFNIVFHFQTNKITKHQY